MEEVCDTIKRSDRAIGFICSLGALSFFGFGLWFGSVFLGVGVSFISAVVGLLFFMFLRRNIRKESVDNNRFM